ncbi:hypothetical protein Ate02nite_15900 [Paractinoplanes tereljensis]|uniref:Uncharacterized protein n=1 Tax=Paractinoplanes tereljensis TaxID=571912 RepID=A0A919TRZ1_9ACTN|nr:hypothetical protein Ate02nite_15900 [Actinoplanes tereljensis]
MAHGRPGGWQAHHPATGPYPVAIQARGLAPASPAPVAPRALLAARGGPPPHPIFPLTGEISAVAGQLFARDPVAADDHQVAVGVGQMGLARAGRVPGA